MIKANIVVDTIKWEKKIKDINKYFKIKINKLNKILRNKKNNHEFSLLLTNNLKMKSLNKKFRKKNKPTDVLSFPFKPNRDNSNYLGDIAVSFEIINKRSDILNFEYELDKMWVHGYLHLLGYNHIKNKDYQRMKKRENLILKKLNS